MRTEDAKSAAPGGSIEPVKCCELGLIWQGEHAPTRNAVPSSTDGALAIFAQDVIEGFSHEFLQAEAVLARTKMHGERHFWREVGRDGFAPDATV